MEKDLTNSPFEVFGSLLRKKYNCTKHNDRDNNYSTWTLILNYNCYITNWKKTNKQTKNMPWYITTVFMEQVRLGGSLNKFACERHFPRQTNSILHASLHIQLKRIGPELFLTQSQIFQSSYKGTIGKLLEQTEQTWLGFYSGVSFWPQYFGRYFLLTPANEREYTINIIITINNNDNINRITITRYG